MPSLLRDPVKYYLAYFSWTEFLLAPSMGPKMSPRSAMTQRSVQALRAKYFQIVCFAKLWWRTKNAFPAASSPQRYCVFVLEWMRINSHFCEMAIGKHAPKEIFFEGILRSPKENREKGKYTQWDMRYIELYQIRINRVNAVKTVSVWHNFLLVWLHI